MNQEEVTRITNTIVDDLGDCDLESCLTVLANLSGQVIAALSERNPTTVQNQTANLAANIQRIAIDRIVQEPEA
jgi:hypothetical protein